MDFIKADREGCAIKQEPEKNGFTSHIIFLHQIQRVFFDFEREFHTLLLQLQNQIGQSYSSIGLKEDQNKLSTQLTVDRFNVFIQKIVDFDINFNNKVTQLLNVVDSMMDGDQTALNQFDKDLLYLRNSIDQFIQEAEVIKTDLDYERYTIEEELRRLEANSDFDTTELEQTLKSWMQIPSVWEVYKQLICTSDDFIFGTVLRLILDKIVAKNSFKYCLEVSLSVTTIKNNLVAIGDLLGKLDPDARFTIKLKLRALRADWASLMQIVKSIKGNHYLIEGCKNTYANNRIHTTVVRNKTGNDRLIVAVRC